MWDIWNSDVPIPEKDEFIKNRRANENNRFENMFNQTSGTASPENKPKTISKENITINEASTVSLS